MQAPAAAIEDLRDVLHVLLHELLDVPLIAALRPPALVVATGGLLRVVADLLEASRAQPKELALFAADDGDDRSVCACDDRHERRQVELVADIEPIWHRLRQRQRRPEVVEARGEDDYALGAVTLEVVVEPAGDALEVGLERGALLVRQVLAVDLLGAAQECVDPSLRVARRRDLRRVEVEIQARRAAVRPPEAGGLPQRRPRSPIRQRLPRTIAATVG